VCHLLGQPIVPISFIPVDAKHGDKINKGYKILCPGQLLELEQRMVQDLLGGLQLHGAHIKQNCNKKLFFTCFKTPKSVGGVLATNIYKSMSCCKYIKGTNLLTMLSKRMTYSEKISMSR